MPFAITANSVGAPSLGSDTMKRMKPPFIGGHVSVAGGLAKAVARGIEIGATAIQIFGGSPRVFRAALPSASAVAEFRAVLATSPIRAVYLHAAYLVNLASPSDDLYEKSIASLIDHLRIAEAIGADGLIFHPGSRGALDWGTAIKREIAGMRAVLKAVPGRAKLLVENTAGGGTKLGGSFDDLAALTKPFGARVGVCLDTAHAFEAGLISAYTPARMKIFVRDFDHAVGIARLVAIHANDSRTAAGSHRDRHENIGEGEIGLAGFRALAAAPEFRKAVWLLEVPGFDGTGPDARNVSILRGCFTQ